MVVIVDERRADDVLGEVVTYHWETIDMNKLEQTMVQHPEMDPVDITRVEVRKVSDVTVKVALEALCDLIEVAAEGPCPEVREAKRVYQDKLAAEAEAKAAAEAPAEVPPTEPAPPPAQTSATEATPAT